MSSAKIFPLMTRTTVVNTAADGPRKPQDKRQPKTPTTYTPFPRKALDEPNSRAMTMGLSRPMAEYLRMVARARPDDTEAERAWIKQWLLSISDDVAQDAYGNVILRIGDSPICWTSHTDTVHWRQGWQSINYSKAGTVTLAPSSGANCLGADCTSGAWLMRQMALQRVPGLYVWFRAEECGALGSTWAAKNTPELFERSKAAISLDRRGYSDVITHQGGARTCSDAFAKSLAAVLNGSFEGGSSTWKPGYKPSSNGVFTDSKQLTGVVGECTNISVGYFGQHSRTESQNLPFLVALLDALKVIGEHPDLLTYTREPSAYDPDDYSLSRYYGGGSWRPGNVSGGYWGDYMTEENDQATRDGAYHVEPKTTTTSHGYTVTDADREAWGHPKPSSGSGKISDMAAELADLCKMYPDVAAELLLGWGVTVEEFADEVYSAYGVVRVS